eukprot:XP_011680330.1 PREDICTED: uncharacterized protein LOC105445897 [Strongylocentrotus purpuratus]
MALIQGTTFFILDCLPHAMMKLSVRNEANIPRAISPNLLLVGIGVITGDALSGYIYDVTSSFGTVFVVYGALLVLITVNLVIFKLTFRRWSRYIYDVTSSFGTVFVVYGALLVLITVNLVMPILVQEAKGPIVASSSQKPQLVAHNTTAPNPRVLATKSSASNVTANLPRCWDEKEIFEVFGKPGPTKKYRTMNEAEESYNQSDIDKAIEFILRPPADVMTLDHSTTCGPPIISYQVHEFPDIPGLVTSPVDRRHAFYEINFTLSAIQSVGVCRPNGGWRSVCIVE